MYTWRAIFAAQTMISLRMSLHDGDLIVPSPAKINLALKVLGRRQDGYHEVETIYQMVRFGDVLRIRRQPHGITIHSTHPELPCGQDNLVWRAARELAARCRQPLGADIAIDKRIPLAAGLGGGSSNAAATLRGLKALYGLELDDGELMEVARTLGADVPFFLTGPAALGRGRGDILCPLPSALRAHVLLVWPNISLSTGEVYEKLNSQLTPHPYEISILLQALQDQELADIGKLLHNDLETVSIAQHPVIGTIKDMLRNLGAEGALMSGSGPTVFGLFRSSEAARRARVSLNRTTWQVIETETVTDPAILGREWCDGQET